MVKAQETPDGQYLPPFGIQNDEEGVYKKYFKGVTDVQKDAIFQIKANAPKSNVLQLSIPLKWTPDFGGGTAGTVTGTGDIPDGSGGDVNVEITPDVE